MIVRCKLEGIVSWFILVFGLARLQDPHVTIEVHWRHYLELVHGFLQGGPLVTGGYEGDHRCCTWTESDGLRLMMSGRKKMDGIFSGQNMIYIVKAQYSVKCREKQLKSGVKRPSLSRFILRRNIPQS